MAILDDFSSVFHKGLGQTERMLEMGRIKSQIAECSSERDQAFAALGRAVYSSRDTLPVEIPEVANLFTLIRDIESRWVALEERLSVLQQERAPRQPCQNCGHQNAAGSSFCIGCGKALSAASGPPCQACGTPVSPGSKFCVGCGTPVEQVQSEPPVVDAAPKSDSDSQG